MSFRIDVISLEGPIFTKTAKGGYNHMEVAYKKDGRVEGKKILDFANKAIFAQVQKMEVGKGYDIDSAKDARDFWQWTSIQEAVGEAPVPETTATGTPASPAAASVGTAAVGRPSGRVTGSNYETPEERARRQVLIVRQSSLTTALSLMIHNSPKGQIGIGDLYIVAAGLFGWVFGNPINNKPQVEDPVHALKQMTDDIPI